jgi:hypothetical protein
MQHLDEGTIHSWLDGALSADEAARVEAHVKECPQCAAAVAEARGFIAASSRILTALDNAPRGVIPAAAPVRRIDPTVWRIAATVLVVAAGTLVVFRNGVGTTKTEQAIVQTAPTASSVVAPETSMRGGSGTAAEPAAPVRTMAPMTKVRALSKPSGMEKPGVTTGEVAAREQVAKSQNMAVAPPAAQTFGQAIGGAAIGAAAIGAAAMDAASEQPRPLKVVATSRTIGAKVTLYEVAPGDTVTLTEPVAVQLQSVVTAEPSRARQAAGKTAAAAPMRRADVESANGMTTISWQEPVTGNMLSLSGRMPAARLQEIRLRIEQERAAAAAAAKKNP